MLNDFLKEDQVITNIVLALYMPKNFVGIKIHKNRSSHGLALYVSGDRTITFDNGKTFYTKENDIVFLPKHSNYEVSSRNSGEVYCINFQCLEDKVYEPFIMHLNNADEILKSYQTAEKAWRKNKDGYLSLCKAELYKIIYALQSQQSLAYLPKSKQSLIQPAVEYIHKYYTDELISIEKLSGLCNISCDYLRKIFNNVYGCSPIKYVNNLKLKRAKELLASGMYSVSETAYMSGFSDLSHFSRFFKENVGVLPSDYLK